MDELIIARCPACAADTEHALLKASPSSVTARCEDCSQVHSFSPPHARFVTLALVISAKDRSFTSELETLRDENIKVGFEFEHDEHRMIVTGMEGQDGRHHEALPAKDIKVLHAKLFDTVPLKLSVNDYDKTRSYEMDVDPDRKFSIGEIVAVEGKKLKIKTLKSDLNRTLHRGYLYARNIRRAFCDEVPHWVKEGKIMEVRKRGKPAGAESQPRHGRKA